MTISMEKIEQQAPGLVSLAKKAQFVKSKVGLDDVTAKVALCLDYSGSMGGLYSRGVVQAAAERILATATQFDDDGAIDVFFFGSDAWYAGELGLSDYQGGIQRLVGGRSMGSTNYAGAIDEVVKHYGFGGSKGLFGKKSQGDTSVPVYVAFLTDGEPNSRGQAEASLRKASQYPIFFQTVGLGGQGFDFLQKLDSLDGRSVDNAGFFSHPDISQMPDAQLLEALLKEFPSYLTAARQANVLT